MAEIIFKEYTVDDLFTHKRGDSKYTRKYCNLHTGIYEVFTGATKESFGFIDTYDYDQSLLTYSTDGEYAGTLKTLSGKFNVGGHRALLLPKDNNLNLDYFKYTLQKTFFDNVKKGDVPSIGWRTVKECVVTVPVDTEGNFDIEIQNQLVEKYQLIEFRKNEIKNKLHQINKVEVEFLTNSTILTRKYKIKDIFDLTVSTNSSKFTRTFIKNNPGEIPVYGASKDKTPSYGHVKDNALINEEKNEKHRKSKVVYFEDSLTYNIDGLAGYVFYREGRFSLSEKVKPLIIRDEFKDCLNPVLLKYTIEPIFRNNIKGRLAVDGKNEYTKLNTNMIKDLEISIPVNSNNEIDLEIQNELANKYELINQIKKNITQKCQPFLNVEVKLNMEKPIITI